MERTARRCHIIRPPGTVRFGYNGEQVWQCRVCQVFFGTRRSRVKFVLPSSAQVHLFGVPSYDEREESDTSAAWEIFSYCLRLPDGYCLTTRSCIVQAWDPQGVKVPPVEKTTGERGPSSQMMKLGAEASMLATPVRTGASKETQNPEDNACE
ncbi:hypothetical protein J6590_083634 [Homalodisca vitripennis]|nr:hypothetical protein J6590_083634 [Homalodisca vitripennis]